MKNILTQLIKEDIRTTRLVRTLARISVDANVYMSAKSSAVFYLLELNEREQKEALQHQYFQRVEHASDSNNTDDTLDAENIVQWLSGFSRVHIS
jgi:hypothetical protein